MGLLAIVIIGLVAGLIARALVPGSQAMGVVATTILGVAGSFVGALVINVINRSPDWLTLQPTNLVFSVIGALVVLALTSVGQRVRS